MRIVVILLISQVFCQTGIGQGTVYFCNRWGSHLIPAEAGTYQLPEGHAQLWTGTNETSMQAIVSSESPTTYFYDTGLFNGEEVTLPNTPIASPIVLMIRVWARNYATFENVTNNGAPFLESNIFPYITGGPPTPAPFMEGLTGFTLKQSLIPLTITATNRSKTYGETVPFAGSEFTKSGLINNDHADRVTLASAGAAPGAAVAGSPYAIVPSAVVGGGLGNCTISYVNGTLTVVPNAIRFLLSETQVENGVLKLVLATSDGVAVALKATTNFKDWTTLDQSVSSNGRVTFTPAFAGSAAKRYYRARIP